MIALAAAAMLWKMLRALDDEEDSGAVTEIQPEKPPASAVGRTGLRIDCVLH